ncbi:hypothetical protein HAX54_039352, partial [Datura stramonium]|nr:hypothetical protein [Datura stramonium]
MDLGVFDTFRMKLKKKQCTKQELKREKNIWCNTMHARQAARGSSKTGTIGCTRNYLPRCYKPCEALPSQAHSNFLPSALACATQHWMRQQQKATRKRFPTAKNGSLTSTRKRNFKSKRGVVKQAAKMLPRSQQ